MTDRARTKTMRAYRLSDATLALIDALAQQTGLNNTTIIEQAVREYARQHKINVQAVIRAAQEGQN